MPFFPKQYFSIDSSKTAKQFFEVLKQNVIDSSILTYLKDEQKKLTGSINEPNFIVTRNIRPNHNGFAPSLFGKATQKEKGIHIEIEIQQQTMLKIFITFCLCFLSFVLGAVVLNLEAIPNPIFYIVPIIMIICLLLIVRVSFLYEAPRSKAVFLDVIGEQYEEDI